MLKASQAIVIDENFGPNPRIEPLNMPALQSTTCRPSAKSSVWAQGLISVPDVPHAANVSFVTEGSGVGVSKEPPVNVKVVNPDNSRYHGYPTYHGYQVADGALASRIQEAVNMCFIVRVAESVEVVWETVLANQCLYVEVPQTLLPEGSKESLVALLEYAEESLDCNHVILCFKKARTDRANLVRTFMFLGFTVVAPGNALVPNAEDLMFLAYTIDSYDSD